MCVKKKIFFATVVVAVALGAAEIVLRIVGLGPVERGDVYESVRQGHREGRLSICVLGGSSVKGYPFAPRGGFPEVLDVILDDIVPDADVRVSNCGLNCAPTALLASLLQDIAARKPDVVVVYAGHNEWLEGQLGVTADMEPIPDTALKARLSQTAVFTALWRLSLWLRGRSDELVPGMGNVVFRPDGQSLLFAGKDTHDELQQRVLDTFERNLRQIATIARDNEIELILCTVASNRRDWPPLFSLAPMHLSAEDYARWSDHYRAGLAAMASDMRRAKAELERARAIHEDHAGLLFSLAKVMDSLGEAAAADALYRRAAGLDAFPSRATVRMNQIVRDLARAEGAELVDIEKMMDVAAEGCAPGFDLFVDNCHPTLDGHVRIALEVARGLERRLAKGGGWTWKACPEPEALDKRLGLTDAFVAQSLVRIANRASFPHRVNDDAAAGGPERFFPRDPAPYTALFQQALGLSEKTVLSRVDDEDPDCCYHLAAAYKKIGRNDEATYWARRAVNLKKTHVDAHQLLIELYNEAGEDQRAEEETDILKTLAEPRRQATTMEASNIQTREMR